MKLCVTICIQFSSDVHSDLAYACTELESLDTKIAFKIHFSQIIFKISTKKTLNEKLDCNGAELCKNNFKTLSVNYKCRICSKYPPDTSLSYFANPSPNSSSTNLGQTLNVG